MNTQVPSLNNILTDLVPTGAKRLEVTELHVHLGGSVPLYRLWDMGIARGIRGVAGSYEDFISALQRNAENTGDLDRYLEVFDIAELIQAGPQAVAESIRIAINGAYRTGGMRRLGPGGEGADPHPAFAITQLELRFNPMKRTALLRSRDGVAGLYDADRIIGAACEAADESDIAYGGEFKTGLIFCFGRDLSFNVNRTLAEKVRHWKTKSKRVIGIDLAGPESVMSLADDKDLENIAELYSIAGDGLGKTIHLGETEHVTIETFCKAIKRINPQRVSHPIVAAKSYWNENNAEGLELLAEKKIFCELCIQSNLLTKAISSAQEYHRLLKTFDEFGIAYTFSTDSPALQRSTLASELDYLLANAAISAEQIKKAFDNSTKASFI